MGDTGTDLVLPAAVPQAGVAAPLPAGARPLRNPKHEFYARGRAEFLPALEAYRRAGFTGNAHTLRGNAARLERNPAVADRIAWLARQSEEITRAKARRLEEFLWLIHETNVADYWEWVSEPLLDVDKNPILDGKGRPRMVKRQRLKPFQKLSEDHQRCITSLKYTDSGRPMLETYSKMQANIELRKHLRLGASPLDGDENLARMSDAEILSELARQARELGIDVQLTYGIRGDAA